MDLWYSINSEEVQSMIGVLHMNIKCTQNIYKSANGVSNVTYYILVPEGVEVRGIVQLSHGMCEYFRATPRCEVSLRTGLHCLRKRSYRTRASVSRTADLGFCRPRRLEVSC